MVTWQWWRRGKLRAHAFPVLGGLATVTESTSMCGIWRGRGWHLAADNLGRCERCAEATAKKGVRRAA